MVNITFTFPDDKVQRVIDAMKGLYQKEEGYTDSEWAKESIRRLVVREVYNYEMHKARQALNISEDNTLLS